MKKNHLYVFYMIGVIIILVIKYIYRKASCAELDFILAPTARWVTLISGIQFTRQADIGYVNHSLRFIIAPSCSGVQFMLITFSTLFFPLVHRTNTVRRGAYWLAGSIAFSYPFTVFVNGLRIMSAIYIPVCFVKWNIHANWLTAPRLHTIIGTVVYVTSLLAVYPLACLISRLGEKTAPEEFRKFSGELFIKMFYRFVPPMLCYFSIALVIPFLHNARQNDFEKYLEYAALILSVSLPVMLFSCIAYVVREHLKGKQQGK